MNYNCEDFKELSTFMLYSTLDGIEMAQNDHKETINIKQCITEAIELIKSLKVDKDYNDRLTIEWKGSEKLVHPDFFEYSFAKFKETLIAKLSILGKFNSAALYIEGYLKILDKQYNKIFC